MIASIKASPACRGSCVTVVSGGLARLAREIEAVEYPGMMGGFAVLALAPSEQVVGGATGQVFQVLYVVFAKLHQHCSGDSGKLLERVIDTQLLSPGIELGFLLR